MKTLTAKELAKKILNKCSAAGLATPVTMGSSSSLGTSSSTLGKGSVGTMKGPDVSLAKKTKIEKPQVGGSIPPKLLLS